MSKGRVLIRRLSRRPGPKIAISTKQAPKLVEGGRKTWVGVWTPGGWLCLSALRGRALPTALPRRSAKSELGIGVVVDDAQVVVVNTWIGSEVRDAQDPIPVLVQPPERLDPEEVRLPLAEPEVALYRRAQVRIGDPGEVVQPGRSVIPGVDEVDRGPVAGPAAAHLRRRP